MKLSQMEQSASLSFWLVLQSKQSRTTWSKRWRKDHQIVEILAKNAVNAVEQVASETGYKGDEKLEQARDKVRSELTKYNISMTDKDLDTFVESAVKQMNDAWKGE